MGIVLGAGIVTFCTQKSPAKVARRCALLSAQWLKKSSWTFSTRVGESAVSPALANYSLCFDAFMLRRAVLAR
jgi:hypothetical protein